MFKFIEDKLDVIKWSALVVLILSLLFSVKMCNEAQDSVKEYQLTAQSTHRALQNSEHELVLLATKEKQSQDSIAKLSAKILNIKPKQVISYKYIEVEKVMQGEVLYDLIEVDIPHGSKFKYKFDECSEVELEWGTPTKWKLKRSLEITDVNYFKRKNLFGAKFLPKWGKKEYYQTILTNCNDSIVANKKIIFSKTP